MNCRQQFSRRSLLRTLGAGGALLPLLETDRAWSQPAFPKRLVIFNWAHNGPRNHFYPVQNNGAIRLSDIMSPVEAFKADMLLLASFDLVSFRRNTQNTNDFLSHGALPNLLTGYALDGGRFNGVDKSRAGGASVDQYIANELHKRTPLPFKSLVLGAQTMTGPAGSLSYEGKGSSGITAEQSPALLFARLFEGREAKQSPESLRRSQRERSILDLVGKRLESFAHNLGSEDRNRVGTHLSQVREVERQIALLGDVGTSCQHPEAPTETFSSKVSDRYPQWIKAMNDLAYQALKCDLTRVITMQWGSAYNGVVYSWLGDEFRVAGDEFKVRDGHDIAHHEYKSADHTRRSVLAMKFYWEQVAYFLGLLKSTPEGDGNMLDHTAVVVVPNSGENHHVSGLPFTIFGRCGGAFKPGRILRVGTYAERPDNAYWETRLTRYPTSGVAHNRVLTSLCQAMDVPMSNYGDPGLGEALPGLAG